jgi:hypothetical protein
MPSPFPGMDPYLEHPAIFPDLHDRFATLLSIVINERLPAPYYAGLTSRVWVETTSRNVQPDVHLVVPPGEWAPNSSTGTETAVLERVEVERVVIQVPQVEFREEAIEIFAEPGGERLVTHIEILSLSNKRPGSPGRKLYLQKQREILDSQVNLVELDLLRGGEHTIAVPLSELRQRTRPHEYCVCSHQFDHLGEFVVYPIPIAARLPAIPIPLLPGDPDVMVDLQAVLASCYETGRYERRLRYESNRLDPPLSEAQQAWADAVLKQSDHSKPE